jgi:hypothetical protein
MQAAVTEQTGKVPSRRPNGGAAHFEDVMAALYQLTALSLPLA